MIISNISADNNTPLRGDQALCLGASSRDPQSLAEALCLLEAAMNWLDDNRMIVPAAHVSAAVDALREAAGAALPLASATMDKNP